MSLGKNIRNVLSGGAVIKAQQARIAVRQQLRLTRREQADRETRIQARYEAAYWNQFRSYLPGFIQSAREDVNALSRQEILRRVRYFEKNSGVLSKVLRCLDVNVIGSGITPSPSSDDSGWNKKALAWWNEWATSKQSESAEQSNYYKLQSIVFRAQNVDGDCLVRKTTNAAGRPALEVIEGHRVGSGGMSVQTFVDAGFRVVDGVVLERKKNRPVAYLVADDFTGQDVETVPASEIVKHFNRKRAGQVRGISIMHAGILDLHDKDDLQKYEMLAAKDGAQISRVLTSAAGGFNQEEGIGASLSQQQTTDPTQRAQYLRQALGGETVGLFSGEKFEQFESKRPSGAMTGFWNILDKKVVHAAGISYAALVDYEGNWGGATLRAVLQSDNRTYELETIEQSNCAQDIWEYAIGWAIAHGELGPNPSWNKVRWHPPRRTTVDVGNDSSAMIEELKAGIRSMEVIYGETGEDWKERLEQRAIEEQFIDQLAKKYNVDRQYISSFAQERLAGQAPDAVGPQPGAPGAPGQPAQKGAGKGQNQ